LSQLSRLLQENTAGDPTGRRGVWTGKRLRRITEELRQLAIRVSPHTVRRLLDQLGYALHANSKSLSASSEQRDEQFGYIAKQKRRFLGRRLPIISVDTKKKELVGNFKNSGRVWSQGPVPVNDHDFRSQAEGLASPYGVYDLARNRGSLFVGVSHDTPEFAADNIARWWRDSGRRNYPNASQLLILADSGGSNGARVRAWKHSLQQQLVNRFGVSVTVCHYPTGASKWNPIEHRLFSEISKHWAGQPLDSYPTILRLIRETRTQTGLRVSSFLVTKHYATGEKVSDQQMREISLQRHSVLPEWNYTLRPRENRN
jgi:Rhodopirellula transposase DDE domain